MTTPDSSHQAPPAPPEHVPSVVDTLDPDLAAAYRSGNAAVIQAVQSGMTTNALIVNELIRTGASMSGMPPAVQALVNERRQQMDEEEAAKQARMAKALAAVVGAGILASNIPQGGMYYGGEGTQANPDRDMWRNVSSAELALMSYAQWSSLTETQKQGLMAETTDRAQDLKDKAGKALFGIIETVRADSEAKGLTAEQNTERTRDILGAITQTVNQDGLDLKTPEGLAAARANIARLKPEDQALALKALDAYAAVFQGQAAEDKMTAARHPGATDRQQYGLTTDANGNIAIGTQHIEQAQTPAELRAAYGQSQIGMRAAADTADAAPADTVAGAKLAGADNLAARATVDSGAAKADAKVLTQADGYDEAPTTAAPRLTINAQPLAAAGMLQPEGVVAANDPQAPDPEQQRPRAASPAQGMGGMAG